MQTTHKSAFLHRIKYPISIGCLLLGFAAGPPQGQSAQDPPQTSKQNETPRFELNIKNAGLHEVLMLLTKNSPYSLIMEPGIDEVIPVLDLKNVTMEEALQSILPGLGLEYQLKGNLLKVRRPEMQTRLFYLNYIAASRSGKRDMRMTSRSQSNTGGTGGLGVYGGGGQSNSNTVGGSSSENQSTIVTTNKSEVWMDLRLGLENIVFSSGSPEAAVPQEETGPMASASRDAAGHRLLINPQAGVIMIHAEPDILNEAANYIEAVEGSVQREVLIEARVVEVTLSHDYQLGVDWTAILNPTSKFSGLLPDRLGVSGPSIGFSPGSVINQNVNPSLGGFQYAVSNSKVGMIIDALSRQGQLRMLSSPRISTLNNQKAVIRVVREEVFFTQTSLVSQSVGPTVTTENIENQIVPIGVVLDIIPQIAPDGQITLSINPSISELVEIRTFSSEGGNAVSTQPVIDRRDLDTVAKVYSGETVLIAGIMRERKSEDLRGIPWLMHLPFLGNAFRRTEQSSVRTELVIFITPTLVSGKRMENLTKEENERLKEMEQPFKLGTIEPAKQGLKGEVGLR
jgi:MSHA biogenesis protein MshL